jgi:hypothetical protein
MLNTEITDSTRMRLKNNGINNVDDFINKSLDRKTEYEEQERVDNFNFRHSERRHRERV